MMRRRIQRHLVLGCALLPLLACKSTPPAAEAPPFVPYELLDAGDEPRAPLRYAIADGTTTTSVMSWKAIASEKGAPTTSISGLKRMEIRAVLGPAETVDREIRYDFEIVDSRAVAGQSASEKLLDDIEEHADFLRGLGASTAIDDRGHLLGARYNEKASNIPLRLLWVIDTAVSNFSLVVLPPENVGVGARWQVRSMLALYGIKMRQEVTYTLVKHTGDEIVLDVQFQRVGDRQIVEFPEDESLVEVESSHTAATGRVRLGLKTLGGNGTAKGTVRNRVVIVEKGERETREIDESFEIQIRSTTKLP